MLSNHDVTRHLTRYGRADTSGGWHPDAGRPDLALGTRRARAAMLLSLALPGSAYVYQGEELGLWEVEDIPDELIADPVYERTGHAGARPGRLPRAAALAGGSAAASASARTASAAPWLPQPAAWRPLAADAQDGDQRLGAGAVPGGPAAAQGPRAAR